MRDRHLYFAFGSNMDGPQMRRRCPSARWVGLGTLPGQRLCFPVKGAYRPGGVASIEPCPDGGAVEGVIWDIDTPDLLTLDEIEVRAVYDRLTLDIHADDGARHPCQVYRAYPQGAFAPDGPYLELIIEAARSVGLSPAYLTRLEAWRTA